MTAKARRDGGLVAPGHGHMVMDVAYRLAPETDLVGMVHDVKRSVAWMRVNGAQYGVNPERIVVGGGSAGGQTTLLAAYAEGHPELTPPEPDMRLFAAHEMGKMIMTGEKATERTDAEERHERPAG